MTNDENEAPQSTGDDYDAPEFTDHEYDAREFTFDATEFTDDEAAVPAVPLIRRHPFRFVAGATVAATGLALGGWGMVSAAASGSPTAGFPSVSSLHADSTIDGSSVASSVDKFVVDITAYDGETGDEDAGTGMVVTSNGEVLTNNHVVAGATKLQGKVIANGKTYTAKVLGTDATDDVALIQLEGVSGLTTMSAGDTSSVTSGIAVAAIGNAEAKPGLPSVATGKITATGQSITAGEDDGSSEQLHGLLETDADVIAGDSGGPLADSSGQVVGMDTAGSASDSGDDSQFGDSESSGTTAGFAIPITRALTIAKQIASGKASSTVVIGTPGLLGVEVAPDSTSQGDSGGDSQQSGGQGGYGDEGGSGSFGDEGGNGDGGYGYGDEGGSSQYGDQGGFGDEGGFGDQSGSGDEGGFGDETPGDSGSAGSQSSVSGAAVEQVVSGSGAAAIGLGAGDVITSVGGHPVTSATDLSTLLAATHSGDQVSVGWTDSSGASHTATATLGAGPAA
jgi:S1-C subfamily serine protease